MEKWELEVIDSAAQAIGMHARIDEWGALRVENENGAWVYRQEEVTKALSDIAAVACIIENGKKAGEE